MYLRFFVKVYCLFFLLMIGRASLAQNSVLVNFGSNICGGTSPSFSMIKNPLSSSPVVIANCDFSQQAPDYTSIFIAYNPKNNKIYIADNRTGSATNIWLLDVGLPVNISCPSFIPVTPTYSYSYIANNFEFDNNGDLWSFSNYDASTGVCSIDKFDVNTGNVISTKMLQFPAGNFPTTVESGDLTILPNGRMFACLGTNPCKLYEITDYTNANANIASAAYLQTLPKDCFAIAYINGILEASGTDGVSSCYYYDYNIVTGTLGAEKTFQNGQVPIDNTSFTPSVGSTKRLLNATKINDNTADLVYELYQENLGNVVLNNVNLTDDLGAAFGAANVSNVTVSFVPGSNAAGLVLNPSYNGTSVTDILNAGQNLPNKVLANQDYFFKVEIHCRVTNLNGMTTYLNSAVAKGDIGGGNILTLISVADSSNNGDTIMVDPNKNGNAGDIAENVPTPFLFSTLPVRFLNIDASLLNKKTALVKWQVATPTVNAAKFEVEYSIDGRTWQVAGFLMVRNRSLSNYQFSHFDIPNGKIYYRIRQTDNDGTFSYSKIVLLHNNNSNGYVIYPNPANDHITISADHNVAGNTQIELYDAAGRKLVNKAMKASTEEINTVQYSRGTYFLKLFNEGNVVTQKVIIRH